MAARRGMRRFGAAALVAALVGGIGAVGISPAGAVTGGSVRAVPSAGERFTLTRTLFSSADCSTGAGTPTTLANLAGPTGSVVSGLAVGTSVRLQALATAQSGAPFTAWSSSAPASELVATTTTVVTGDTICVAVPPSGTARTYVAGYASDTAPAVVSTDPIDGDVGIALDRSISVEFTEPVALAPDWLTLSCSKSGAHTGATTGAGAVWTFDPDADFVPAEECVAAVAAAAVRDADTVDPPDGLAAEVEFFFTTTTEAPDRLPPWLSVSHVPDGAAGWDRSATVAVSVAATDNRKLATLTCTVDGAPAAPTPAFVPGPTYTGAVVVSGEGVHAVACASTDAAGNLSTGPDLTESVAIDSVAPVTSVVGVTDGATFVVGVDAPPVVACATTDDPPGSGPATAAALSTVATLDANGAGPVSVTCAGGTDVAGNGDAPVTVGYAFVYGGVGGVLAPVASGTPGLVTRGRTVPVKLRLAGDAPAGFSVEGWVVERKPVACSAPFTGPDAGRTEAPLSRALQYDAVDDEYQAGADFRAVPAGSCWRVRVVLGDGQATDWSAAFRVTGNA